MISAAVASLVAETAAVLVSKPSNMAWRTCSGIFDILNMRSSSCSLTVWKARGSLRRSDLASLPARTAES
eukprot:scaffold242653_cov27-Tisochrysis_lutea.AAC.3